MAPRNTILVILMGSLAAFGMSLWISEAAFCRAPITTDEQSYIMQAHLFAEGKLKHPAPPLPQAFRYAMIILDPAVGWFSRYPPGHALWLTPGVWLGSLYTMIALAAALGLALVAWSAKRVGGSVAAAVLAMLLSPFFLFNYGTLMSHTTGFVAAAGMLAGYIRWQQTGRGAWALLAGLAWSWLLLNRTYTALLMALPFAADALWQLWKQRNRPPAWIGTALFAGSALAGVAAILLYNYLTLGNPLKMTYLHYDPSDNLGFGWRHNYPVFPAPDPVFHTFGKGLRDLRANLLLLDRWLFGFPGGLAIWAALTAIGWSRRWSLLLVASAVAVWIGYLFFWYPGWNATGPNYYTETHPAMILTASMGVAVLLRRHAAKPRARTALVVCALIAWAGSSVAFSIATGRVQREELEPRARVIELFENAPPKSLILIERPVINYAWPNHDLVFNPRGLNGDVIVARWIGASNGALLRHFSDYTPMSFDVSDDGITLGPMDHIPTLRMKLDISQLHRKTGANLPHPDTPDGLVRVARASEHHADWLVFGRTFSTYPATFQVKFDMEITDAAPEDMVVTIDVAARSGRDILATRTFHGNLERQVVVFTLKKDDFVDVEPRAFFRGNGEVRIYGIEINDTE